MNNFFEKLKNRLNITSNKQFWTIMLVFALTGFTFLFVKKPIYEIVGITPNTPFYLRTIIWILCVFPMYYVFLLFYGFIFGQFNFFWGMVKKSFGRIPALFKRN
ncbi:MAG: hypothetical protein K2X86_17200 [Cytophagaceae bacterium]|nr:hypothetical protein [Cytophagaceae bacterium]